MTLKIPKRIARTLISSLKGGVVPRIGLPYITVGRKNEIDALLHDVEVIADGGASFRFIVGECGWRALFQSTDPQALRDEKTVGGQPRTSGTESRLQGTKGQGLATYRELVRNMATKTRPEGGALPLILDRWINEIQQQVVAESGIALTDGRLDGLVEQKIGLVIQALNEMVHGFDFARLLTLYYRSYRQGDEATKAKVIQWFRGEFHTKTEARQELGVNIIISDEDWYEYLKIFALFLKQAGYAGLLVCIDELVNIYKIPHAITRQYNYEKILTMYNDTLQGKAHYLGIIMGGTPQCMEDPRRGVYSYEALRSRLAEGHFGGEHKDLLAPVIRLQPLTSDEMLVLVEKLAEIHGVLYGYDPKVTQEDLVAFIRIEFQRIGADSHITPREVIRDFIEVLDILYQHPELKVEGLLHSDSFQYAKNAVEGEETAPEFAEFTV